MVDIICEMLLTTMSPVVQVREVTDPIKQKDPGVGQKYLKNLLPIFSQSQIYFGWINLDENRF